MAMPLESRVLIAAAVAATILGVSSCARASQAPRKGMGAEFQEIGTFRFEARNLTELVS
jgi:hypothetical protein